MTFQTNFPDTPPVLCCCAGKVLVLKQAVQCSVYIYSEKTNVQFQHIELASGKKYTLNI